jgi:hypothetical protein
MRGITSLLAVRASRTRASWLLLCLLMASTAAPAAAPLDDAMPSTLPTPPTLGAHTMLNQSDGEGSAPAMTAAVNTQESGSSLLVLVAGYVKNADAPSDSYGNLWKPVGEPVVYNGYDERFDARAYLAIAAHGGKGHTVQVAKDGAPAGEITMPFIEIAHAGKLQDVAQNYPSPGVAARTTNRLMRAWQGFKGEPDSTSSALTSGTVTTTGPATLVAVWLGDAYVYSMSAIPGDGFKIIDSYLQLPPNSGVQAAVAVRQVDAAGTYSVTWHGTPAQGAILWLFAFQAAP